MVDEFLTILTLATRRQKDALSSGHPLVGRFEVELLCQQLKSEISTKLQSDQKQVAHNQNITQFTMRKM